MPVKKLFWDDPYLTTLDTRVNTVENGEFTLFETIAFAFSGGQQSDAGTMNGNKILNARKAGTEIFYSLGDDIRMQPGDPVHIEIDWDVRYKLMKLHFAAEIILELVNQNFGRPTRIGANITTEKSRLDFIWENNISEMFPVLTVKAKEIIDADLPVISAFSDVEKEIRYWRIEGFGQVPCGGTHIRSTGEIGAVRLKRDRQGKSKERIEIYLA